jgi:hypothetical protein
MVTVDVGNVTVMRVGLVRPVNVFFLQRTVKLKGVHPAPIMVTANVVLVSAVQSIQENTVKI